MRKIVFTFSMLFIMALGADAQEVGIRFGDVTGGDVAVGVPERQRGV